MDFNVLQLGIYIIFIYNLFIIPTQNGFKNFLASCQVTICWALVLGVLGSSGCEFLDDLRSFYSTPTTDRVDRPYVILVSIDGYRPDYTDRFNPPTLSQVRKRGVSAEGLIPAFPPDTFPDHMSLATGLYPENHGLTANYFYDPDQRIEFNKSRKQDVENSAFFGGTPLWVAAEKAGVRSAALFWPGSEVAIEQIRPSYFYYYDSSLSHRTRVDQVATLLDLPYSKRPHFICLYFSAIDSSGHKYGPDSDKMKETVLELDAAMKRLLDAGKNRGLRMNAIFVSGHGMQTLDPKANIYLEDFLDVKSQKVKILGDPAHYSIYSEDKAFLGETYQSLKAKSQNLSVYRRNEVPPRLHHSKNKRVGDLVLLAAPPYSIYQTRREHAQGNKKGNSRGGHGFDPFEVKTMKGLFYAIGPNFKQGVTIPEFESIHVYPMILKILGIPIPKGIDGREAVLAGILEGPSPQE